MSPQHVIRKLAQVVPLCGAVARAERSKRPSGAHGLDDALLTGRERQRRRTHQRHLRHGEAPAQATCRRDGARRHDRRRRRVGGDARGARAVERRRRRCEVDYDGAGAPADADYRVRSTPSTRRSSTASRPSASIAADGSSMTIYCQTCTSTTIPVHVEYADGTRADVDATSSGPSDEHGDALAGGRHRGRRDLHRDVRRRRRRPASRRMLTFSRSAPLPGSSTPVACTANLVARDQRRAASSCPPATTTSRACAPGARTSRMRRPSP